VAAVRVIEHLRRRASFKDSHIPLIEWMTMLAEINLSTKASAVGNFIRLGSGVEALIFF